MEQEKEPKKTREEAAWEEGFDQGYIAGARAAAEAIGGEAYLQYTSTMIKLRRRPDKTNLGRADAYATVIARCVEWGMRTGGRPHLAGTLRSEVNQAAKAIEGDE